MKVNGKVVLVTGAGNGMGREITLELVRRGAKVAAVDMRQDFLDETKKLATALGGTVETFVVDVTDAAKVAKLPADVEKKLGSVDVLMNNAGIIQPFVKINELDFSAAQRVMNVNFYGPFMMVKAFLPSLLKKSEAHILNVSSMGSYAPVPGQSVYGASKAAVKLFTEGLRSELLGSSVGVTVVFPGGIATNITGNSGLHMEMPKDMKAPKTTPAPVAAKAMVDAIENNTPRLVIGQDAKTMDFLSRLNPVMAANLIYKQMANLLK